MTTHQHTTEFVTFTDQDLDTELEDTSLLPDWFEDFTPQRAVEAYTELARLSYGRNRELIEAIYVLLEEKLQEIYTWDTLRSVEEQLRPEELVHLATGVAKKYPPFELVVMLREYLEEHVDAGRNWVQVGHYAFGILLGLREPAQEQ